jgi:hypothetical protein
MIDQSNDSFDCENFFSLSSKSLFVVILPFEVVGDETVTVGGVVKE